ncbi:tumor protein p53-inducible protein 13 [Pygocentrus nattereri]|uniref:Tumor protein p53-inducible protein 13 n=1 Tax=Pygocentrus nattereri TaxID=42514 RepID=A0A3B4DMS0_PYGNA|nr:tumor protein p53-inducible protein 13 [Pygocentrus nattereri]
MRLTAVVLLLYGFLWLFLMKCCHSRPSQGCDTGQTNLETDLPQSDGFTCPEPWPHSTLRLADISVKHPLQPAEHICMNMPIKYNHTIPNSGAHRPVGAMSGEYLYCPPQRWLNNLKDGAAVLLYHPCASEDARRGLALMAHSCLPHYILTAHPQLSQRRPFALASWGRTLEMSHVTSSGVCEWLLAAFSSLNQSVGSQRPKYSLFLTKAAPVDRVLSATVKSLRACCVEALSAYEWTPARARKSRAALQTRKGEVKRKDEAKLSENSAFHSSEFEKLNSTQTQPLNITEDKETLSTDSHSSHVTSALRAAIETDERTTATQRQATNNYSKGETGQEEVLGTLNTDVKSYKKTELEIQKHRVKTDTAEQGAGGGCGGPGQCRAPDTAAPKIGGPLQGHRMPTPRTDEAVWAAAALGFLLVLLTLSVLHTRLYRNWRTPPSLYWHETRQDYESVADIIRRRLRMVGRRKRRASQSRRQECPLLPDSSTDNESD